DHARQAAAVLVPEPSMPDGGVKTRRRGVATYRIETTGQAAHAGIDPGLGISASQELAHQPGDVLALAHHARGAPSNGGLVGAGTLRMPASPPAWASARHRRWHTSSSTSLHSPTTRAGRRSTSG